MMMNELGQLLQGFESVGVVQSYFKILAANDNSKNQVYFGPGFEALNIFPHGEIVPDGTTARAGMDFWWMDNEGGLQKAPRAQLILYPDYPEVRFSGFLKYCQKAPSDLMTSRDPGRVLFLGVTSDDRVIGYVVPPGHPIAETVKGLKNIHRAGVFYQIEYREDDRRTLLLRLREIHLKGWIPSKRLDSTGRILECNASHCGGYTLEAELGITPNGIPLPDYLGYEVKQYAVTDFESAIAKSVVTLMTPEPTGGYYQEYGPEAFVRRFGYPDLSGKPDRLNFGGIFRYGTIAKRTGMTLNLTGYDLRGKILDIQHGGIVLTSSDGERAAFWSFLSLMEHWSHKHAKAVYVPSMRRDSPREYQYGPRVFLGHGTDFKLLLDAIVQKDVYYDPAVKIENASISPQVKRRSQFRIRQDTLGKLYHSWSSVDLVNNI